LSVLSVVSKDFFCELYSPLFLGVPLHPSAEHAPSPTRPHIVNLGSSEKLERNTQMTNANDLRDRAEQFRQQLPERRTPTPPTENGRRIGTIERSTDEQIRVNWSEYEGKRFLSIRMWKRGDDGQWWPDGKRGMSVRIRELPDLAAAIAEALDLAEANQRQWRESQANRPAPPMPGRRMDPATLPLANGSKDFDEFSEDQR